MKANELRIGCTYLSTKFNTPVKCTIEDLAELDNICQGAGLDEDIIVQMFKPIPLTEEWLIKFGGIDYNYCIDIKCNRKTISFNWFSKVVQTGIRSGWYSKKYRHIKYVHQLQNLYFALTGTELKIK